MVQHKGQGLLPCHGFCLLVVYGKVRLDTVVIHRILDNAGAIGIQSLNAGAMEICHGLLSFWTFKTLCNFHQGFVDTRIHFCRGLAGKGEGEDFRHLVFFYAYQVAITTSQHKGFSRSRSCGGNSVGATGNGCLLFGIQALLATVPLQKPLFQWYCICCLVHFHSSLCFLSAHNFSPPTV